MQSGAAKLLFSYRAEQSAGSREEISGSFFCTCGSLIISNFE